SGLDRVVPVDRITDFDLSNNAAGVHDGDRAGRRLDLADCLERRSPRYMGVAATRAVITWRVAGATKHETPPCAAGCPFLRDAIFAHFIPVQYFFAHFVLLSPLCHSTEGEANVGRVDRYLERWAFGLSSPMLTESVVGVVVWSSATLTGIVNVLSSSWV